jgi:thioesterase domain-containing protein
MTEMMLASIWCEVLHLDACINISKSFFELGGNSLLSIMMMGKINTIFAANFHLKDLFEDFYIRHIARKIDLKQQPAWSPLVSVNKQDTVKPNLYILPGLIGCSSAYYQLGHLLSKHFSVKCIEARGLYGDGEPHYNLHEMLDDYYTEIIKDAPSKKIFLIGHSAGCLHVCELNQKLRKHGFVVEIILLDNFIKLKSYDRPETYSDEEVKISAQSLLSAIKRLYTLTYPELPNETTSSVLQNIANYLFPDNAISNDYKLKIAKGFANVFMTQSRLNAKENQYEIYGCEPTDSRTLLVLAEEGLREAEKKTPTLYPFIKNITIVTTSGEHLTMLNKQHVIELADKIIDFTQGKAQYSFKTLLPQQFEDDACVLEKEK